MKHVIFALALLTGTAASAADWVLRPGDQPLSPEDLAVHVVGRTLEFYDGGVSRFSAGGAYSYSYDGGNSAYGVFQAGSDGTICISFRNGWSRCDMYVRAGEQLVLITEDGVRFPIRD